jgi:transcriptional regulator with XRE-family HTH domain
MIAFKELSQEILKHIRAKNSVSRMDGILSLGNGQYLRWESGQVEIKWDDFILICKKMNVPMARSLHESLLYSGNIFHYDSIIQACVGKTSQDTLGKQLGVTRYTVNRWMNRKASPTLTQILQILQFSTTKLPLFIETLVGANNLPSFKEHEKQNKSGLGLIQEMPWISGVLCSLELQGYHQLPEHKTSWIAHKIGMNEAVTESTLKALENYELIKWNGHHYEVTLNEINPSVLKERARDLLLYWLNKNIEAITHSYPSPDRKSLSSYHIFSADTKTAEDIKKLYVDFTKDLAILLSKEINEREHIYSFTLSMIHFDEYQKIQNL